MGDGVLMEVLDGASHGREPDFAVPLGERAVLAHHIADGAVGHEGHGDVDVALRTEQVHHLHAVGVLDAAQNGQLSAQVVVQLLLVLRLDGHYLDGVLLAVLHRSVDVRLAAGADALKASVAALDDHVHFFGALEEGCGVCKNCNEVGERVREELSCDRKGDKDRQ